MSDKIHPLVSVIIPMRNEAGRLRPCLLALKAQAYQNFELIVFDNDSDDNSVEILRQEFPAAELLRSKKNYFVGGAVNRALPGSRGKYVLALCADVLLDEHFLERAVNVCESDEKFGALQAKILKSATDDGEIIETNILDTTGFLIFKSARIINRGHGEEDCRQFRAGEVFSYEGAAGFFRREALEEAKINGEVFDEDFSWMADDIDLGWRLRILGWKNYYAPDVICWHDRKTTKRLSAGRLDFISQRKTVPALKRRLDFQNTILTYFKNMFWGTLARHFFVIVWRELQMAVFIFLFERSTIPAFWGIIARLPAILRKRRNIMRRRKINANDVERWLK